MPYTPPGTLTAADRNLSSERNHHRSRSFTDEKGPGAFAPLAGVPRRNARPGIPKLTMPGGPPPSSSSTATTSASIQTPPPVVKSPKFELHTGSDDTDEDDDEAAATAAIQNPLASKIISHGTSSPTVHGHSEPLSRPIPFPSVHITASSPMVRSASSPHIHSPSTEQPSPSMYRSPFSSLRGNEPNTRDRFPLKPALKSNHSSPHLPSLAHQRALTQSAPSTPNLQKTAWASSSVNGGSAPGSPGSTYSIPPTPKSVHFATEKSVLESVVVFSKGARPRSLSNPGGYDTETETEGYDSTAGSGGSRYPFPVMPKNEVVPQLDEAVSSEVPMKRALGSNGLGVGDERHFVYLETIMLPSSRPPTLRGSVLVRNVAFQKRVAVRFTLDDWQTISEVSCNYSASLPNIPPPFSSSGSSFTPGHGRSATIAGPLPSSGSSSSLNLSNGKSESWDRFTFTIKLEDVERTLPNKRMFLVVKYQVPSQWGFEHGGEWWDNNSNKNYEFGFKLGKKATANSAVEEGGPSALAARMSASMNRGHDTSPVTRTQSLPPLPPPGPVRANPSPLSISPNNSVLGLGGLGKVKPVLPPIVSGGPKLRAGRGPTFTDVPSPRGSPPGSPVGRNSPTRSTNYTPPLPGSVPGITHGITSPNLAGLERPAPPPAPKPVAAEPAPAPAPAPTPAPPQPVVQPPKPQALTISTANLSPTATVGKKRGLSLSNYVSPTMVKSPSSMSINNTSMQNMNSLMGNGGDGGENAYAHGKQPSLPYVYTPPSTIGRKDSQNGPLTPGSLRLVGGMPATIIDENGSAAPVERVPSWDIPLNGLWNALGQQKPIVDHQKKASDSEDSSSGEDQTGLPTPPESSADSTLSTPDLERSPEAESVSFDDEKRKDVGSDRDTPTPTLVSTAGPAEAGLSSVPFPRSSPAGSPRSSDGGNTVRHASPELPTPQSSDVETKPPSLSNLGRRTSLQTGQTMRLDLPQRPKFDIPPAEELSPTPLGRRPSPSTSSSSGSENGSPTKTGLTMKSGKSKRRRDLPDTTPVPQFGLGLNMGASPASGNGPPPEFLAKYCFFVSSPGVSPPTSNSPATSSAVTSPSAGFGTGVDTPRASSPGLSNTSTWWGYSASAVPERA